MYMAYTSLKNKNTNLDLKNLNLEFYNVCSVIIDEIKGRESVFIKYEKIRNNKYVKSYVVENNIVYHKYKDIVYENMDYSNRDMDNSNRDISNMDINLDNSRDISSDINLDNSNRDINLDNGNTINNTPNTNTHPLSLLDSALSTADESNITTIMYNRSFFCTKQENINILKELLKKENKIEYLLRLGYLEQDIEYYKECCSNETVYGFNAMASVYIRDSYCMARRVLECSKGSLYGCILLGYIGIVSGKDSVGGGSRGVGRDSNSNSISKSISSKYSSNHPNTNNISLALDWFLKGLKYNSKSPYCCLGVGLCLVEKGFKKEGIDILKGCYREVREVSYNLGKIFYDSKDYKESLKWYIEYYRGINNTTYNNSKDSDTTYTNSKEINTNVTYNNTNTTNTNTTNTNTNVTYNKFLRCLRDRIIVLALRLGEDTSNNKANGNIVNSMANNSTYTSKGNTYTNHTTGVGSVEYLLDGVLECVGMEEEVLICKIRMMVERNELEIKKYLKYLSGDNKRRVKGNEEERNRVEKKEENEESIGVVYVELEKYMSSISSRKSISIIQIISSIVKEFIVEGV
ncbi:hypothetical protein CWI38_2435p0010 [Hamiltosporidium tvaerminnensis]|uniref:Uncharacterized protein n=1 Tax=Hamiltosporidium tvaerminnensis TaxID=1176355 RepID=A0A4Q9LI66_9MICR|nr:hypothetical protein CWI38_2435p0010 [Hamiltosporidium tvaerminnensis]